MKIKSPATCIKAHLTTCAIQSRLFFRADELVARGVQLRAQSVGDQQIRFNVYIFNIQPGVTINYADGTSRRN
ncbi:hypothetical protein LFYK43_19620 [Ligilactobacillus salitolerans]|uniref:Uncharacterized protein n=1 Tax=Ligilactobacillus salitolerans TaxID=1808352 RepID=A0A401IVD0_9LACO|nr:hypothetical protein LFYK43_19620 [Ligilactobacillus salitolerans]